jgi:transcriptional regulator with XRE-family HTH domain
MDVGRRIREVREDLGMPAAVLARRIGVAPNTVWRYESGEREPSMAMLEKIARELRTEPAELLRERTPEQRILDRYEDQFPDRTKVPEDLSERLHQVPQQWESVLASVRERQSIVEAKVEELIELAGRSEVDPYEVQRVLDEVKDCEITLLLALPGSRRQGPNEITIDFRRVVDLNPWEAFQNVSRLFEDIGNKLAAAGLVTLNERPGQRAEAVTVGIGT